MARRRLSKRRLALFAGVLLCAAFGARRVAIRFSSPTSIASGDPAPSSGSAGAAHGLGAHARFGALQHGSRGRDGPDATDATRATPEENHGPRAETTRSDAGVTVYTSLIAPWTLRRYSYLAKQHQHST